MLNKSYVEGVLNSGPRQTKLTEDDTPVTFFEVLYFVEGSKQDSTVRKSVISCVCYGSKATMIHEKLKGYLAKSEGGDYEGMPPNIFVEGSLQSRKIKVGPNKKQRIMEINIRRMTIIPADDSAKYSQEIDLEGLEETATNEA